MNLLSWLLGFTFLLFVLIQSVVLSEATVCRQEAWRKSFNLLIQTTLTSSAIQKQAFDPKCRLHIIRSHKMVLWQRLPSLQKHAFKLDLKGKL